MPSKKLSQLTTTATVESGDLLYIVRGSTDLALTGAGFVAQLAAMTIPPSQITQAGATTNQVLAWNGSAWVPTTVSTGSGTVTSVSVTTANGVSGTVATATTTPAITLTLGAITPTTVNGITATSGTNTFTLARGTASITVPAGLSGTLASGAFSAAFDGGSPGPLGGVTPSTAAFTTVTATSYSGLVVTANTSSLNIGASKDVVISNSLTFAGTDGSTLNIGGGGTLASGAFAAAFDPTAPGPIGGGTPSTIAGTTISATEQIVGKVGTPASPAFTFVGFTNSGLLYDNAIGLKLSIGGTVYMAYDSLGAFMAADGQMRWNSGTIASGYTPDVILRRGGAGILDLRDGANAQALNVYNTFTDASNYERAVMRWATNVLIIGTEEAGSGTLRDVNIVCAGLQINGTSGFTGTDAAGTYVNGIRTS